MKIELLQAGESVGELDLSACEYKIGSGEGCKILIDDPSIAECHARLAGYSGLSLG
jgi:hypothetical protein